MNIVENVSSGAGSALEYIATPGCKTIEEVCDYFKVDVSAACKAVVYQKNSDDTYVVAFVRGDYSVNETKLRNLVGEELHAAEITADAPLVAGYIGPYGLSKEVAYYCDLSLKGMDSLVAGANREGFHLRGLNLERELGQIDYADIAKVKPGGICPCCKSRRWPSREVLRSEIFSSLAQSTASLCICSLRRRTGQCIIL